MSNMMADKSQNRLLLEPTKTSKVNNKPNCSNKLCFPLILILIIYYIFEGGAYIRILKETHVWGGLYLNHDSSIRLHRCWGGLILELIPNVYANVVQATDGSDTTFEKACDINSIRDFIVNSVFPPDMSPRPLGNERDRLI